MQPLGIPVGAIHASAYARASETADLAFGRVTVDSALYISRRADEMRQLLSERPLDGTNRLLIAHNWMLHQVLSFEPGQVAEGEVVVVEPLGENGFRIITRIHSDEWRRPAG